MTKKLNANIASSVSFLLIFTFNISLFWCNDTDRFHSGAGKDQGTSVCSLQDEHASSQENTFDVNPSECSCICHVPTVAANPFSLSYYPATQQGIVNFSLTAVSASLPPVFRPPIA